MIEYDFENSRSNAEVIFWTLLSFLFEQFPSNLLLFGGSYALNEKWTWSIATGIRFSFSSDTTQNLILVYVTCKRN